MTDLKSAARAMQGPDRGGICGAILARRKRAVGDEGVKAKELTAQRQPWAKVKAGVPQMSEK